MPLKVVPAGDQRCDIHNRRSPAKYVCKSCLKEFGIDPSAPASGPRPRPRVRVRRAVRRLRSRANRRMLLAAGVALIVLVIVIVAAVGNGGGDAGDERGGPTEQKVVDALELSPNPTGTGWITSDGACAIVSIDFGKQVQAAGGGPSLQIEATNESGTVGAVVTQNDFSVRQEDCVNRIAAALRANF